MESASAMVFFIEGQLLSFMRLSDINHNNRHPPITQYRIMNCSLPRPVSSSGRGSIPRMSFRAERSEAEEGNRITIKYRVSFEQFMNKEQAGACARHDPRKVRIDGLCGVFLSLGIWYYKGR